MSNDEEIKYPYFEGDCKPLPLGLRRWKILESYTFHVGPDESYTVPAGYITDGASVPRFLWWLYPPFRGDYDRSVGVHDVICEKKLTKTSKKGHKIFHLAMKTDNVKKPDRNIIYAGVRIGGPRWRK